MAPDIEQLPVEPTSPGPQSDPRKMTRRELRRRIILLTLLVLLLALLSWLAYYSTTNRRLPTLGIAPPGADQIAPPQFLYSISGTGASELRRPVGVGVAADGRVYVVDFGNKRVSVFTNAGRYLSSFSKTEDGKLVNPVHLVVRNNEVLVSDRKYRCIYIFDLSGKYLRKYETKNEDFKFTPLAFSFDATGALRATDVQETNKHRLLYFSADGSRTATVGKTGQVKSLHDSPGSFLFPAGIAVAANGDVFVSDGDNRRVQVYNSSGQFLRILDTSGVPRGIAIDAEDRVYIVDALAHTVGIYDPKGRELTRFGSRGYGPGQFNYPNDVTIGKNGRIYVTDRENHQVQVWGWPSLVVPAAVAPGSPLSWLLGALCCFPLLLLPLLMRLRRKIRIVVTPEFVAGLESLEEIAAIAARSRLRLVAPIDDQAVYAGRVVEGVRLDELITFEEYSESDVKAMIERLGIDRRQAILLAMAARAKALGVADRELRLLAMAAEIRVVDVRGFREVYLGRTRESGEV